MKKEVIILGAGPAGLSAAYEILKNPDFNVTIIDRANIPGGAGASFQWKDHTLDYGPHAFHSRGDEPEKLIREIFKDSPNELVNGVKKVSIYLNKKFFKYPLQVGEAIRKFNPFLSMRIIFEFFLTSIFHAIVSIPVESFENWGRKRFGASLYKLSFGNYTEKVWKTKPNAISHKFASEKIQGFSFVNLILKLLRIGGQVTEPYYQTWIYHRNGSGQIYLKLAEKIREKGGKLLLDTQIESVDYDDSRIKSVKIKNNKKTDTLVCDYLINSIQVSQFINLLGKSLPFLVKHSSKKLKYISLVLIYIEFELEKISDNHWFYLLEQNYSFNRVTEQKNLSSDTIGKGKTVLSFELTCHLGDADWRKTDEEVFELAKKECLQIDFLKDKVEQISDFTVKRVPNVYEIYYKNFEVNAEYVLHS